MSLIKYMVCKHFFLFWRLPLHFLDGIFSNTKVLNVDQVLFFFFFSFVICDLLLFFCKSYVISVLTFRPVTHFELSFLHMVWGRYLWRRQWRTTPVLSPGQSHGRRSLEGCSPWGLEESDTTERLHFHFSLSRIGEGDGTPLQYSCLENPMDGGAW